MDDEGVFGGDFFNLSMMRGVSVFLISILALILVINVHEVPTVTYRSCKVLM